VPKVSQDALRRFALKELVDGFFGGSEEELVRYLRTRDVPTRAVEGDAMDAALL